jgi:hypothetical protein
MAEASSESPYRVWHLWYARAMALVGFGVATYGCVRLWQTRDFAAHAIHAQAPVVDYKVWPPDKHGGPYYEPIVRFTSPAGGSWQRVVGESERHRAYPLGHPVGIVYAPGHPDQFEMDDWVDIWLGPFSALGIGLFAMLLGLGMAWFVSLALARPETARLHWWDRWFLPINLVLMLFGR